MNILKKILNDVSADGRIVDGIFEIQNNDHMDVLREYLIKKGIEETEVIDFCNNVLEGKFPERQAYNKNGILVTFPTPEYKQRAIQRGTHFEKKPAAQSNLFAQQPTANAPSQPLAPTDASQPAQSPEGQASQPQEQPKTSLPLSTSATQPDVSTTSAPDASPESEPAPEPTELPPPEPKTPEEKQADQETIKSILQSDDSLLEEVSRWVEYNAPEYIRNAIESVRKK